MSKNQLSVAQGEEERGCRDAQGNVRVIKMGTIHVDQVSREILYLYGMQAVYRHSEYSSCCLKRAVWHPFNNSVLLFMCLVVYRVPL